MDVTLGEVFSYATFEFFEPLHVRRKEHQHVAELALATASCSSSVRAVASAGDAMSRLA